MENAPRRSPAAQAGVRSAIAADALRSYEGFIAAPGAGAEKKVFG